MDEAAARQEAARCLNCGVCSECMACVSVCEAKAIDHTMTATQETIQVGSIILATGYDLLDPTPMQTLRVTAAMPMSSIAWSSNA